jgi:hypothetical protein
MLCARGIYVSSQCAAWSDFIRSCASRIKSWSIILKYILLTIDNDRYNNSAITVIGRWWNPTWPTRPCLLLNYVKSNFAKNLRGVAYLSPQSYTHWILFPTLRNKILLIREMVATDLQQRCLSKGNKLIWIFVPWIGTQFCYSKFCIRIWRRCREDYWAWACGDTYTLYRNVFRKSTFTTWWLWRSFRL